VLVYAGIKIPGQPGRPVISRLDGRKVTIDWTPPDTYGGSQIVQYIIYYSTADVESLVKLKIAGKSKSCTFNKLLKCNTTYKFAVAAKNKSGLGPLSEFSEYVKTSTRRSKNIIVICYYYCYFLVLLPLLLVLLVT